MPGRATQARRDPSLFLTRRSSGWHSLAKHNSLKLLLLALPDTKIFKIGGKKIRVSVLETTKPAAPLSKMKEMVVAQQKKVKEEQLDDMHHVFGCSSSSSSSSSSSK